MQVMRIVVSVFVGFSMSMEIFYNIIVDGFRLFAIIYFYMMMHFFTKQ